MKYFLLIFVSIVLAGCNNSGTEHPILVAAWTHNLESYNGQLSLARTYISDEPELNKEVSQRMDYLDSLLQASKSHLESNSQSANQIISDFTTNINSLFQYTSSLKSNAIPSRNSFDFAMLELTRLGQLALGELSHEVGANDMKFDQIKVFIDAPNTPVKLGQELRGTVYMGIYSTLMEQRLTFTMNGDTLITKSGSADFSYKPIRRGVNKVKFEVTANYPSMLMNNMELVEEVEIYVE